MGRLFTLTWADLRQRFRDKSVLMFGLVVPAALMFVMNLVFGGLDEPEIKPATVAVAVPDGDQLAAVVPAVLERVSGDGFDITVQEAEADTAVSQVEDGDASMALIIPKGFGADLSAGEAPETELVLGSDTGLEQTVISSIVADTLAQLTAGTRAVQAAAELGANPGQLATIGPAVSELAPQVTWTQGAAADEQLTWQETMVAGQAGMFLLFTVGFGVLGLVLEREWGTLGRMLSMPMRPSLIVVSKGLSSFLLGLLSMASLLTFGALIFDDVAFGSLPVVAVLVMLAVAAGTSVMFIIAKVARTAEQAGVSQAIVAIVLGMSGGAFFQINASGFAATLLHINPIYVFTRGLGVTSGGGGIADLGPTALMLGVFTVICLGIAIVLPERKDAL